MTFKNLKTKEKFIIKKTFTKKYYKLFSNKFKKTNTCSQTVFCLNFYFIITIIKQKIKKEKA